MDFLHAPVAAGIHACRRAGLPSPAEELRTHPSQPTFPQSLKMRSLLPDCRMPPSTSGRRPDTTKTLSDFAADGYSISEMQPKSDAQLLREYAEHGAEAAFAEIVARHTNLVYSAALRQVDSPDIAAEVAQSAFIGLARGARSLSRKLADSASLPAWLCRS